MTSIKAHLLVLNFVNLPAKPISICRVSYSQTVSLIYFRGRRNDLPVLHWYRRGYQFYTDSFVTTRWQLGGLTQYLALRTNGLVVNDKAFIQLIKGAAISPDNQPARRDSPAKAAAVPRGYLYRTSSILEQLQEEKPPPIATMGEKTWHHVLCFLTAVGTYVIIILFTSGAFGHKLGKYLEVLSTTTKAC